MRILNVCTTIGGDNAEWWRISNLAKIFQSNGHEVHFVHYSRKSSYESQKEKVESLNKENEDHEFVISSPATAPIKHLKKLFDNEYDLVFANNPLACDLSVLGKLIKTPLICDLHGGHVEEFLMTNTQTSKLGFMFKLYSKKLVSYISLKTPDKITCVSKHMINYLNKKKGVPLEKLFYVTNGVDLEFFQPQTEKKINDLKTSLGLQDKLVFGYLGAFHGWQGADSFISCAKKIKDEDLAFVIVGGKSKSVNNNLFMFPRVNRSEIIDYYSICDVLVLPRPMHPATAVAAPTKFAEYLAMGKPVLTTNVGDAATLVENYHCGFVVKDNSRSNLTKGIKQFKGLERDQIKVMGKHSRYLAEKEFDWNNVAFNLLKVLEN